MNLAPYDYQEEQIRADAALIKAGKRRIINQLNTGGGKTIEFATITFRFNAVSNKRSLILVHRKELMTQCAETIDEWYGTSYQLVEKGNKYIYDRPTYIGMVETVFRRLSKNSNYFPEIGLIILDECHIGNFKKIHQFFPNAIIIGFTATPLYTDMKYPIKMDYEDVVVGPLVNDLIARGKLCQNITRSVSIINRKDLSIKGNDFDEHSQFVQFAKARNVEIAVDKYEEFAPLTKAICYNVNIEHSKIVMEAFKRRGYDCRHVDGTTPDDERDEIFEWFDNKKPTILCNVGIATMGYDNPYVQTIMTNFSTLSLVKWLQCGGRGGRICPEINKTHFCIIDLGGNGKYHGDWNHPFDWKDKFVNPPVKRAKEGGSPYKECPMCSALIALSSTECKYCGYIFPRKRVEYDTQPVNLELITRNLDVKYLCEVNSAKNEFYTLFYIENNLLTQAKYKLKGANLSHEVATKIINEFMPLANQWCQAVDKPWAKMERYCKKHILSKMKEMFQYEPEHSIKSIESLGSIFSL